MGIEFKATITIYELLAISFSVLIPFGQWFYSKFIKKANISFIPNKEIELFFNRSGNYVRILSSCLVENKSIILKNVKITITRNKDCKSVDFLWSCFISTTFQNMPNGHFQPSEYIHPIIIDANSVKPLFLELVPSNNHYTMNIVETQRSLTDLCLYSCNRNNAELNYIDYKNLKERALLLEIANNCFFWLSGEYSVDVLLEYDENSNFRKAYRFRLSEADSEKLKNNINLIADLSYNDVWNKQTFLPAVLANLEE